MQYFAPRARPAPPLWLGLLLLACALLTWRAAAFSLAGATLYVDEAQYWFWAQQLDWGYFSKPPGIAALIAASTGLFGDGPLAVKALAMLCYPLAAAFCHATASRLYDEKTAGWAALVVLTLPIYAWLGLFASTDALLTLAWCAGLYCYQRAITRQAPEDWLLLGLVCGLGLLAKYTMLLFIAGILLHLALYARPQLRQRGPWLAATLAVLLLLPNLQWNLAHDFPTLRHTAAITLGRSTGGWRALAEFIAAQWLALGPLLGCLLLPALRPFRQRLNEPGSRLLLCLSLPLLLVSAVQAWQGGANANWAAPALAPLALLLVGESLRSGRQRLLAWAIAGNLALTALLYHTPALIAAVDHPAAIKFNPYLRATGWDALARQLRPQLVGQAPLLLLADNRTLLAHFAYELRDLQPQVVSWNPDGIAGDHFELISDLRRHRGQTLFFLGESPPPPALLARFRLHAPFARLDAPLGGGRWRHLEVYRLHDFQDY